MLYVKRIATLNVDREVDATFKRELFACSGGDASVDYRNIYWISQYHINDHPNFRFNYAYNVAPVGECSDIIIYSWPKIGVLTVDILNP